MEADIQHWNSQQELLRQLLEKQRSCRKALALFLSQHAMVHSGKLRQGRHCSFQDEVLFGLTDEQMRSIPKGHIHSVVWALWHITRIEDVTMNLLLADSRQVLHRGKWMSRLGAASENVGNEMSAGECAKLNATMSLKALFAYRLAVGKRTCEIVQQLKPAELWEPPKSERLKRIVDEGAVGQKALWLLEYWGGHPAYNLLLMPATRHCLVHLNEIGRMLPKLKRV